MKYKKKKTKKYRVRDGSTHRMKRATRGANIKGFPRMMEVGLILAESRIDGHRREYDPQEPSWEKAPSERL